MMNPGKEWKWDVINQKLQCCGSPGNKKIQKKSRDQQSQISETSLVRRGMEGTRPIGSQKLTVDLAESRSGRMVEVKTSFNGLRSEGKMVNGIKDNSWQVGKRTTGERLEDSWSKRDLSMKVVEKRRLKKQEKRGENWWSKERGNEVVKEAEKGQVKRFDSDMGGLI